jgi:TRAP-type C4-dicarboxylate transport system permease small subunit
MVTLRKLQKLSDCLNNILLAVLCVYLSYIVIACVLQVFSRYVLNASFTWTEETARYAFVSLGILGIPVALRRNLHVKIDLAENRLKRRKNAFKVHQIITYLLISFASVILAYEGARFMILTIGSKTSGVRMPLYIVHVTLPIAGVVSLWFCIMHILTILYPESSISATAEGSKGE